MQRPFTIALALLLALVGVSCCADGDPEEPVLEPEMEAPSPTLELARGTSSAIQETRVAVARTPEAWAELWAEHGANRVPHPPAPEVDFERHMVVAVFLGTRTSGGYGVEIAECRAHEDRIVVRARETRPAPDAMVTMALTAPYAMVAVPRAEGQAELVLE